MQQPSFLESLRLRQIGEDTFENIHEPWTWPWSNVIPGGLLMSECAVAAYRTVPDDFVLDNLQTHFLRGINPKQPMHFKVSKLSQGKRFMVRAVVIEQAGEIMLHASMTFINSSPWTGPALKYSTQRQTTHSVDQITLDDLSLGTKPLRPLMKFERLPLVYKGSPNEIESGIATSVAQTFPIDESAGNFGHTLGVLNLSDFHVLDTPLQLSNIRTGLPELGDSNQKPTATQMKMNTSLNHTINFHVHNGFRADDLTYIEVKTPWAKDGRAMMTSDIFSKDGLLIATCTQEGFYVIQDGVLDRTPSKL